LKVRRLVQVVDTHTAGEPTRVVIGGLSSIPGLTMEERRTWLTAHADDLRRFLLKEPRGHSDMFGAIVTPPADLTADFGLIFLDGEGYLRMCGHGTIGAVTALASLGQINKETVLLDTPSGLVTCHLRWEEGEVCAVTVKNVPSFFLRTLKWKGVPLHLAYGGNLFALVEASSLNIKLRRRNLPEIVELGMTIRHWSNQHHSFQHPATGVPLTVDLVEFYEESIPPRNVVVFGGGQVDRSPCGTGTCAKMAFLHAQGKLGVGEEYRYQSILNTEFIGRIIAETKVGDTPGILPEVTGSAYVMGIGSLMLTNDDPFPTGFDLTQRDVNE